MNYNTNEKVSLVVNARINDRAMSELVCEAAIKSVQTGCPLPDDLADVFTLQIVTRPSGTRYGVLDFA